MLLHHASALLLLLQFAFGFPRDKTTETPDIPPMVSPKLRRPTHISEFTDPDTGLNPFLDLEEGLTSIGRNVMEDERRDDQPYFDVDLVEGDVPDRRWNLQEPKEHLGRMPGRRPELDYKEDIDFQTVTTPRTLPSPPTTIELFIAKDTETIKTDTDLILKEEIESEVEKQEKESLIVSRSAIIYATVSISVMTVIIVLVGACWWRRKLKSSRTSSTVQNDEVKS